MNTKQFRFSQPLSQPQAAPRSSFGALRKRAAQPGSSVPPQRIPSEYPAPALSLVPLSPAPLALAPLKLTVDVRRSIFAFGIDEWDRLVPRDEPQLRFEFLKAVESSRMGQNPTYIAVRQDEQIIGIAVAYETDIDLLTLASPGLNHFAEAIRRGPLKRFLIARAMSCGPVITNCRPNLFLAPTLSPSLAQEVAELLVQGLDEVQGGDLRVLFEYSTTAAQAFGTALERAGYAQGASLPGTQLEIVWPNFEAYTGAMRKFYRRAVKDDMIAGAELEIRIESDFSALAEEAHALYENVLAKASNVLERLTPEFFAALGHFEQARLVTAREKSSGRLVGIELLLVGDTIVQDLYTGVDYTLNDKHNIYFNLVYPGIALACREGFKTVSTGQTSYAFKSRLGVKPYGLSIFVKHRNPLVNALIRRFKNVLCPVVEAPTHRVFHDKTAADAPQSTRKNKRKVQNAPSMPHNATTQTAVDPVAVSHSFGA
jgi:predicted N-acyltransferase